MCMYITLIGFLVILIKKRISRKIIQRIPKSNILPRSTNNQVRPKSEINTGDLILLRKKNWHFLFWRCYLSFVILPVNWTTKGNNAIWKLLSLIHHIFTLIFFTSILIFITVTGKAKINHLCLGDKRNKSECNLQPLSVIQTKQFKI